jgi:hypothetical protein
MRRVPTLAGAGLALSLLVPGVAAAQDPTPGDIALTPVEISGTCGTMTVSSTGADGGQTIEVIGDGGCEAPIMAQLQAGPMVGVPGSIFAVDSVGPADPFLGGEPVVISTGSLGFGGEPGLPGVVTVAAEPARTVEVTGVDGTNVTLETDDGWTRTVDTANVAVTLDSDSLAASDLKPGDRVQVIQVRNANGTYTITGLALVLPEATGTVSEVTDAGFTITEPDGTETPVVVTDATRWPASGMPGSPGAPTPGLGALEDGDLVHVRGTLAEDGTMTATEVLVIGRPFVIGDPAMPVPGEPFPPEPSPQDPAPQDPAPQDPAPTPETSPAA